MTLNNLRIPPDAIIQKDRVKKVPTAFELKRAAAETYEQLVQLGYAEGMDFPEGWAEHVLEQRKRLK